MVPLAGHCTVQRSPSSINLRLILLESLYVRESELLELLAVVAQTYSAEFHIGTVQVLPGAAALPVLAALLPYMPEALGAMEPEADEVPVTAGDEYGECVG